MLFRLIDNWAGLGVILFDDKWAGLGVILFD